MTVTENMIQNSRAPVTDEELEQWATVRADDAGHLARELIKHRRALAAAEPSETACHAPNNGFFKTISGIKVQLAGDLNSPACEVSMRSDNGALHVNTGAFFVKLDLIEGGLLKDAQGRLWDIFGKTENPLPAAHNRHTDNDAVDQFAIFMRVKLAQKRAEGRGGWDDKDACSNEFLSNLLREHVDKGDPVDVGNLAMMIQQRGERIATPTPTPSPADRGAVTRTDILREWFGGERYARDYEYLDANFGKNADAVIAALALPAAEVKVKPLEDFRKFVDLIEGRAMAADGPVTPFLDELRAASTVEQDRFVSILRGLYALATPEGALP